MKEKSNQKQGAGRFLSGFAKALTNVLGEAPKIAGAVLPSVLGSIIQAKAGLSYAMIPDHTFEEWMERLADVYEDDDTINVTTVIKQIPDEAWPEIPDPEPDPENPKSPLELQIEDPKNNFIITETEDVMLSWSYPYYDTGHSTYHDTDGNPVFLSKWNLTRNYIILDPHCNNVTVNRVITGQFAGNVSEDLSGSVDDTGAPSMQSAGETLIAINCNDNDYVYNIVYNAPLDVCEVDYLNNPFGVSLLLQPWFKELVEGDGFKPVYVLNEAGKGGFQGCKGQTFVEDHDSCELAKLTAEERGETVECTPAMVELPEEPEVRRYPALDYYFARCTSNVSSSPRKRGSSTDKTVILIDLDENTRLIGGCPQLPVRLPTDSNLQNDNPDAKHCPNPFRIVETTPTGDPLTTSMYCCQAFACTDATTGPTLGNVMGCAGSLPDCDAHTPGTDYPFEDAPTEGSPHSRAGLGCSVPFSSLVSQEIRACHAECDVESSANYYPPTCDQKEPAEPDARSRWCTRCEILQIKCCSKDFKLTTFNYASEAVCNYNKDEPARCYALLYEEVDIHDAFYDKTELRFRGPINTEIASENDDFFPPTIEELYVGCNEKYQDVTRYVLAPEDDKPALEQFECISDEDGDSIFDATSVCHNYTGPGTYNNCTVKEPDYVTASRTRRPKMFKGTIMF